MTDFASAPFLSSLPTFSKSSFAHTSPFHLPLGILKTSTRPVECKGRSPTGTSPLYVFASRRLKINATALWRFMKCGFFRRSKIFKFALVHIRNGRCIVSPFDLSVSFDQRGATIRLHRRFVFFFQFVYAIYIYIIHFIRNLKTVPSRALPDFEEWPSQTP